MGRTHESKNLPWHPDGETLAIETPEHARIELRIASFGDRMLAALIDRVILGILLAVLGIGAALTLPEVAVDPGTMLAIVLGVMFLAYMFYFVVAELMYEGRTYGKSRLGLRTVHESGRGIDIQSSVIRNLARVVDEMPIAWIVPMVAKGQQRIGDMLAGTYVVRESSEPTERSWIDDVAGDYASLAEHRFPLPPAAAAKLVDEDLNLVEYLGERLKHVPRRQRRKAMSQVADRYVVRLGLEDRRDSVAAEPERFLLELGLQLRARFERHDQGAV